MIKITSYIILITFFISCSIPIEIVNYTNTTPYGDATILYKTPKKSIETYIIIPDDDTVDIATQFNFMLEVLPKNTSVFMFPKMYYQDPVEKNSLDIPEIRKTIIAESFNVLYAKNIIDSTHKINVIGIGEGTIVTPQLAVNINADRMVLINPHYLPMSENFINIFQEKDKAFVAYSQFFGLATIELWLAFIKSAQSKSNPDAYPTYKPMRYYSFYWDYNPSKFYNFYKKPINTVFFHNYNYTSNLNNKLIKKIRVNKSTLISGSMFSNDFLKELKEAIAL